MHKKVDEALRREQYRNGVYELLKNNDVTIGFANEEEPTAQVAAVEGFSQLMPAMMKRVGLFCRTTDDIRSDSDSGLHIIKSGSVVRIIGYLLNIRSTGPSCSVSVFSNDTTDLLLLRDPTDIKHLVPDTEAVEYFTYHISTMKVFKRLPLPISVGQVYEVPVLDRHKDDDWVEAARYLNAQDVTDFHISSLTQSYNEQERDIVSVELTRTVAPKSTIRVEVNLRDWYRELHDDAETTE